MTSCPTLLLLLFTLTTAFLHGEGARDALACPSSEGHLSNVFVRESEPPGDDRWYSPEKGLLLVLVDRRKIHGGNQLSGIGHYAEPRMQVNTKTRLRVNAAARPEIAASLKLARKSLGFTQTALAQALGSSQGALSRWEREEDSPPISAFGILSKLVPDEQKAFWLRLAGDALPGALAETGDFRRIPVLRDSAAAGTPRAIDENEVQMTINFPREWLPPGGSIYGVKIEGDSMSPFLETGYIVLIDVSRRDAKVLNGRMVAARDGDGVTIKWLRRQDKDLYLLVPQKTSQRHAIQIMRPEGEWSIVGEVIKWIGEPPLPKRK